LFLNISGWWKENSQRCSAARHLSEERRERRGGEREIGGKERVREKERGGDEAKGEMKRGMFLFNLIRSCSHRVTFHLIPSRGFTVRRGQTTCHVSMTQSHILISIGT
jgi:hypothetical protein